MAVSLLLSPARFLERFGRCFGDPAHLQLHQGAEDGAAAGEEGWVCGSGLQPCHPRVPLSVPVSAPGWWQRAGRLRALLRLHLFTCRGYRGDIIDDDDDNGSRGDRWQINS